MGDDVEELIADTIRSKVDTALAKIRNRSLIPVTEVVDWLLDIRAWCGNGEPQ